MVSIEQHVDEEDWARFQHTRRLTSHWDNADWPPSRHSLSWYVLFDDPAVQAYAAALQAKLADLTYLDPIEPNRLPMTIQGVAFADELTDQEVRSLASRSAEEVRTPSFDLELGPISGFQAGTFVRAAPWEPVHRLRGELRSVMSDVLGPNRVPPAATFKPHMSITYCHADPPADALIDRLSQLRSQERVTTTVHAVLLVDLHRHHHAYHWQPIATVPLKSAVLRPSSTKWKGATKEAGSVTARGVRWSTTQVTQSVAQAAQRPGDARGAGARRSNLPCNNDCDDSNPNQA